MAKRAPATRAFVHILRPNKTKPAGLVKRTRRTAKKLRAKPVRTTLRIGRKRTTRIAKAGAHSVGTRMTPRVRKRTIVLRSAGGRFAGSRSV